MKGARPVSHDSSNRSADRWLSGREPSRNSSRSKFPNDHGSAPRPKTGVSLPASYMADNTSDRPLHAFPLPHALVERTLLVVSSRDDPASGVDHVDATAQS